MFLTLFFQEKIQEKIPYCFPADFEPKNTCLWIVVIKEFFKGYILKNINLTNFISGQSVFKIIFSRKNSGKNKLRFPADFKPKNTVCE